MWCVACEKPVSWERKSAADLHLKGACHIANARKKTRSIQSPPPQPPSKSNLHKFKENPNQTKNLPHRFAVSDDKFSKI